MINRREFVWALAFGLPAGLRAAEAQQSEKVVRVAFLDAVSPREVPWTAAFERRLMELGYVEGKNLVLEFRSAGGRSERLQDLIGELVRLQPDVIAYVGGPDGAQALKHATGTIPVIFSAIEWDPVAAGVVGSLSRPGTNLTGVSALAVELAAKRLQLLLEIAPRVTRVAVLWHQPRAADQFRVLREAAQGLKLQLVSLEQGALPHNFEGAFAFDLPLSYLRRVNSVRFVTLIAALILLAAPLDPGNGQEQQHKLARIGYLNQGLSGAPTVPHNWRALREGLGELGYVEGQNLAIDYRFAEGRTESLSTLVAELISDPTSSSSLARPPSRPRKLRRQRSPSSPLTSKATLSPPGLLRAWPGPGGTSQGRFSTRRS